MNKAKMLVDDKIDAKLTELKESVEKIKKPEEPKKPEEKPKGPDAQKVANAVANAIDGLPELAAAYQTRNYKAMVKGKTIYP